MIGTSCAWPKACLQSQHLAHIRSEHSAQNRCRNFHSIPPACRHPCCNGEAYSHSGGVWRQVLASCWRRHVQQRLSPQNTPRLMQRPHSRLGWTCCWRWPVHAHHALGLAHSPGHPEGVPHPEGSASLVKRARATLNAHTVAQQILAYPLVEACLSRLSQLCTRRMAWSGGNRNALAGAAIGSFPFPATASCLYPHLPPLPCMQNGRRPCPCRHA